MVKIISGVIIEKTECLTLAEFCRAIRMQPELVLQMIEHQLSEPQGETADDWRFDSISLKRARIAVSFYHDLEVNWPGIAIALELLEKIDDLQRQVDILEKKYPTSR